VGMSAALHLVPLMLVGLVLDPVPAGAAAGEGGAVAGGAGKLSLIRIGRVGHGNWDIVLRDILISPRRGDETGVYAVS
jgi:hypothetical protein